MEIDRDQLHALTEIGYASVIYGLAEKVGPIFDALTLLLPDNAAGPIGKAISDISTGNFNSAIDTLQNNGVNSDISGEEARAILLLSYYLAGRTSEAQQLANELMQQDGVGKNMAMSLFGENKS